MYMNGELSEAIPNRAELEADYERRRPAYQSALEDFQRLLDQRLAEAGLHPTVKGRIKSFDSLYKKKIRILRQARLEGRPPIPITDVIGLRVVCPFLGDLEHVVKLLSSAFTVQEVDRKGAERSFREFGYESIHLLVELPKELGAARPGLDIHVCEIQLRTIVQEAWAEVEHELVYKAEFNPFDEPMKRKLAALNANLSLSDIIFQEIRDYQHRLNEELTQRRNNFYAKIEGCIDSQFVSESEPAGKDQEIIESASASSSPNHQAGGETLPQAKNGESKVPAAGMESQEGCRSMPPSLDDMLLEGLFVHNRGKYKEAIRIYSAILSEKPGKEVSTVIYKHRGMAYFSESRYAEAIEDFSKALDIDPRCYRAAYYRAVVKCVIEDYPGALVDYDLSLQINPFQAYVLYRRAQAYWHLEDYPKVLADCEAALRLEPARQSVLSLKKMALDKLKM